MTAAIGDTLTFSYFPKNRSVVQSSFADPLAGGVFSGLQPLSAGPGPVAFVVTVSDTKPIYVYCAQRKGSHCQMGMADDWSRPPPSPNTLAYKMAAANSSQGTVPPAIAGGRFISLNSTSSTGNNPTASGTASGVKALSTGSSTGGPSYTPGSGYTWGGSSNSGPSSSGSSSGYSGSSSVGADSGSFTNKGSGSSTGGSPSTSSSPLSFQGAVVTFSSGLVVSLAAPGIVACALI